MMAKDPRDTQVYIGDGVYLSFDGYQLWLAANHHTNRVLALEPEVFKALCLEGTKILQDASTTDFKAEVVLSIQRGVPDV